MEILEEESKGSVYCMWESVPSHIKSQLKQEDGFETIAEDFHYIVKRNKAGDFIIFRSTKSEYESRKTQYFKRPVYRIIEVQALPIEDANKLLTASNQYELVGLDLV